MEGDSREQDQRFAEWYVWAKREVSTDNRVCLGAAQAAIEALETGGDETAARAAARGSTAGRAVDLLPRVLPHRRAYAEWYDWARREIGGGRERQHIAARAALDRLEARGDTAEAAAAAAAAVGSVPRQESPGLPAAPPAPAPTPPPPAPDPVPAAEPVQAPPVAGAPPPAPVPPAAPAPWSGAPAAPAAPALQVPQHLAVPARVDMPPAATGLPPTAYGSFGGRLGAWLIDTVLLAVGLTVLVAVLFVFGLISVLSAGNEITNEAAWGFLLIVFLLVVGLTWLYFAGLESSGWQATLGKRMAGLAVTDTAGHRIGFGRATGRYFSKILSGLIVMVGYLMAAFTPRRQGLHDLIASTVVLKRDELAALSGEPAAVGPSRQPEHSHAGGTGEVQGA